MSSGTQFKNSRALPKADRGEHYVRIRFLHECGHMSRRPSAVARARLAWVALTAIMLLWGAATRTGATPISQMTVVPEDSTVNVNLSELPGLRDDPGLSSWLELPDAELPAGGGVKNSSGRPMNQWQDYSGMANAASPLDLALTPNTITQHETVEQVLRSIATVRHGIQLQPNRQEYCRRVSSQLLGPELGHLDFAE